MFCKDGLNEPVVAAECACAAQGDARCHGTARRCCACLAPRWARNRACSKWAASPGALFGAKGARPLHMADLKKRRGSRYHLSNECAFMTCPETFVCSAMQSSRKLSIFMRWLESCRIVVLWSLRRSSRVPLSACPALFVVVMFVFLLPCSAVLCRNPPHSGMKIDMRRLF